MTRVNPDLAWTSKPWQICLCEVEDLPAVTERFREAAAWVLERSEGRKERVVA
jgi:hypothetical protein